MIPFYLLGDVMRKILFWFLLFLFPFCVHAADKTIFSLNEVTASPGNKVTINLNIDNKEKFGVLTARIHYDKTKLDYDSHNLLGLKNGVLRGADNNADKGLVVLYGVTLSDKKLMTDNGKILEVVFTVKEDVSEDIPLALEIVDFGIDENKNLEYEKKDGIIHIKGNVVNVKPDDKPSFNDDLKEELKKQDVDENDITITSSDEDVATIDENGNIQFKKDGNVTIEAKDKDGKVVYAKEYLVNNKKKISYKPFIYIGLAIIAILILLIMRKKKWVKRK